MLHKNIKTRLVSENEILQNSYKYYPIAVQSFIMNASKQKQDLKSETESEASGKPEENRNRGEECRLIYLID